MKTSMVVLLTAALSCGLAVADGPCPRLVGRWSEWSGRHLALVGDLVLVAGGSSLVVLDLAVAESPVELSRVELTGPAQDVVADGRLAYVAVGPEGEVLVVDLVDPRAPRVRGRWPTAVFPRELAVAGDAVVVLERPCQYGPSVAWLSVVDVSDPDEPHEVGAENLWQGYARNVAAGEGYAYVTDSERLRVVDVNEPTNPIRVWSMDRPAYDVEVSGDMLLVAESDYLSLPFFPDYYPWLSLWSLADPGSPQLTSVLDLGITQLAPGGLAAGSGALATLTADHQWLVDVRDPSAPVNLGSLGDSGWDLALRDGLFVTVKGWPVWPLCEPDQPVDSGELTVWDVSGCTDTVPTATFEWSPPHSTGGLQVAFRVTDRGLPTGFAWDFGDGQVSSRRSPTHRFPHPGTFTVTLTASNANGSTSTTRTLRVRVAAAEWYGSSE